MQTLSSVALLAVFAFAALSLQGCGCDKEESEKCFEEKSKDVTAAMHCVGNGTCKDHDELIKVLCKALDEMIMCITQNNCCDEEEDGKRMGDEVNRIAELYKSYGCKVTETCE